MQADWDDILQMNNEDLKDLVRKYRRVQPEMIKETLQSLNFDDSVLSSKYDKKEDFYIELTDSLNDMIEQPSGETSKHVADLFVDNNIDAAKFDEIINNKYGIYGKDNNVNNKKLEYNKVNNGEAQGLNIASKSHEVEMDSIETIKKWNDSAISEKGRMKISEAREQVEFQSGLENAKENVKEENPHISNKPKKDTNLNYTAPKGTIKNISDKVVSLRLKNTKDILDETAEYTDLLEQQAKYACKNLKVTDCKTQMGDELEEIRTENPMDLNKIKNLKAKAYCERKEQIEETRNILDEMQTAQIRRDLEAFVFPEESVKDGESNKLSDKEIEEIIYQARFNLVNKESIEKHEQKTKKNKEKSQHFSGTTRKVLDSIVGDDIVSILDDTKDLFSYMVNDGLTDIMENFGINRDGSVIKNYVTGLNEDGSLYISNSRLTIQDLEKTSQGKKIEEELRQLASMPKVIDLTDEEVLQLAYSLDFYDNKVEINFNNLRNMNAPGNSSWMNSESPVKFSNGSEEKATMNVFYNEKNECGTRLKYMKNMESTIFYDDSSVRRFNQVKNDFEDFGTYDRIIEELDALTDLRECQMLQDQVDDLYSKYNVIEDRKSIKDLNSLRKIVKSKYNTIQEEGFTIARETDAFGREGKEVILRGERLFTKDGNVDFQKSSESVLKSGNRYYGKLNESQINNLNDDEEKQ